MVEVPVAVPGSEIWSYLYDSAGLEVLSFCRFVQYYTILRAHFLPTLFRHYHDLVKYMLQQGSLL